MRRILASIALAALSTTAQAAPVLNTIVPCPATAACLYVDMFSVASRESTAAITGPNGLQIFLTTQGRLNDGAPRLYDIQVVNTSLGGLTRTAYLGRSPANNPLIQTDRGVLEIMDPAQDLDVGRFYVIDTAEWKVVEHYLALDNSYTDAFVFTASKPAAMWIDERKLCISAPVKRPGLLQILPKSCVEHPKAAWSERVWGDVKPEALELGRIKQLLPNLVTNYMGSPTKAATSFDDGDTAIALYRIKGTSRVVVVTYSTREG